MLPILVFSSSELTPSSLAGHAAAHTMKDLIDVHTFGLWGPTFLHLRHGVPLGRVGAFLLFPSLCSIFGKVFQAPFESRLTSRGVALVRIRKMSTAIACATQLMCEPPSHLLPGK